MRIAHIGSKGLPSRGGTERVVEAIAVRQAISHDVTVYGSRHVCESGEFEGVRIVALPVPKQKYLGPVLLDLYATVSALWTGYDVVHVHGSENAFVMPLLRLRSRVVSTNHGRAYERAKWSGVAQRIMRALEGGSVRWADAATAVASTQAEYLQERYERPVRYIPNGIDESVGADRKAARGLLDTLGLVAGRYVMFAAARVDPTKGALTLIRAWRSADTGLPLLVMGDLGHAPGHEEELRSAAEGSEVVFLPRTDDKALLLGLVAESALFVFPSTVEAMSMMLLEAVAVGAPVLASDIPENTRVLPVEFPVFRAGDEAELATAMNAQLAVPETKSRANRVEFAEGVRRDYAWDRIADQYLEVYAEQR